MLIVINVITRKQIEVAENDLERKMSWNGAIISAKELGEGWRLPTDNELKQMCIQLYEKGKGNFKNDDYYWGCIKENEFSDHRRIFFFNKGGGVGTYRNMWMSSYVRLVRDF
jgi:hypothetical protein